jgi:2-polyprenyl-3-methyl-5-hydroxy-6-metoxy-1,4-benzoquinol methylase
VDDSFHKVQIMDSKRIPAMDVSSIQEGNQAWWTSHTMSYDWKDQIGTSRFSAQWFDETDARFVHSARLFATNEKPFDRIIPFDRLAGRRVLEIGCGMGLHSELLARAGARLSAIDLSPTSVEATQRRFELKGLAGEIRQADAEALPFADGTFDFVWSWGVIHHSSRTARIVREIRRILKPSGSCRLMVYNRGGIIVPITFFKDHLLKGRFLKQDFDATLLASSDGFSARFYTPDQLADLLRAFFAEVRVNVFGLDADAVPLPSQLRQLILKIVPDAWLARRQARDGAFLFVEAEGPD